MKNAKDAICYDDSAYAASVVCYMYNLDIPYVSTKFCSCVHYMFLLLSS
jgi:hypothetical protein